MSILKVGDLAVLQNVPSDAPFEDGETVIISGALKERLVSPAGLPRLMVECYAITVDGLKHYAAMPRHLKPVLIRQLTCTWEQVPFWFQITSPRRNK